MSDGKLPKHLKTRFNGKNYILCASEYRTDFIYGTREEMRHLATLGLSGSALSLLLFMVSEMEFNTNLVHKSQTEFAEALNTRKQVISRLCQDLMAHDLIRVSKKYGKVKIYQVSPYYFSRGSNDKRQKLIELWDKAEIQEEVEHSTLV